RESHRRALMNRDSQVVRHEAHDARRLDPGNMLELRLTLSEGDKENVAANVAAHYFENLRAGNVLDPVGFNVVAGFDAEAPRVFAVAVHRSRTDYSEKQGKAKRTDPSQSSSSLFG